MLTLIVGLALLPAALVVVGWILTFVFWAIVTVLGGAAYLISLPFKAVKAIRSIVFGRPVRIVS